MTELKHNLWLWLLSGRSVGFDAPWLNTYINFPTAPANAAVKEARKVLCLASPGDFHALGAMAAALSVRELLLELPTETSTVFATLSGAVASSVTGGELVPADGTSWPSAFIHPASIPAASRITFRHNGGSVAIDDGIHTTHNSDFSTFGQTLRVDDASAYGVHAMLLTDTSWAEGREVTVNVKPTRYPFAAVADSIKENAVLLRLMSEQGTMEAFGSPSPLRRVGALAAAVMLAVYRETIKIGGAAAVTFAAPDGSSLTETDNQPDTQLFVSWSPLTYYGTTVTYAP